MKTIKLRYVDTMSGDYKSEYIWELLTKNFVIDDISEPDYIISGGMGYDFAKYDNCVRIQFVGENIVPDFNMFDYAIGFDHMDFGDRYIRVPLYFFYKSYHTLLNADKNINPELCKRDFCCYVVSNAYCADPKRDDFFKSLSEYRRVDSAGRHLNNMGGGYLKDKLGFVANYKFNIAFENSSSDGYTTEKVMEPMVVNTIPIYWGNPSVSKDFNKDAIICLSDFDSESDCIEYIKSLDTNDELYLEKLSRPWITEKQFVDYETNLVKFFDSIFDQNLEDARRVNQYGLQSVLKNRLNVYYRNKIWLDKIGGFLMKLRAIRGR